MSTMNTDCREALEGGGGARQTKSRRVAVELSFGSAWPPSWRKSSGVSGPSTGPGFHVSRFRASCSKKTCTKRCSDPDPGGLVVQGVDAV